VPIIATNVGGVPEIFGAEADHLVPVDDRQALADAIRGALDDPSAVQAIATAVQARARTEFSLHAMVEGGLAAYREALAMQKLAQFT
jgi:glycosyltransferase involved in cell wall biosynthesis